MSEIPAFINSFSEGNWWVVPAYAMLAYIVSGLDASFFTEEFKSTWPKPVRMIWDFVSNNIGKSRNSGSAD